MEYIHYKFRPSETIDAVLRLIGRHDYSEDELKVLRQIFNEMNGTRVPKVGEVFKLPLEEALRQRSKTLD